MRLAVNNFLFIVLGLLILQTPSYAVDLDIGLIVEQSPDKVYMQLHNRTYKVTRVEKLDIDLQPLPGTADDLAEGDLVSVVRGEEHEDFCIADLVTLYQGQLANQKRLEMELPPLSHERTDSSLQQTDKRANGSEMVFENGVWHN